MNMVVSEISKDESMVAKKSFLSLQNSLGNKLQRKRKNISITIEGIEEPVAIPQKAFQILEQTLKNMAEGTGFSLLPENDLIGTQEAVELLNISRPYLVKLLEDGEIPFLKAGTHRRVLRKNILLFHKNRKAIRKKNLNLLAKQAQELKLGYE